MNKKIKQIFSFFIFFSITACSVVDQPFKLPESTVEYAESLFLRQNMLTQQIMMSFDGDLSVGDAERVSHAEMKMHDACFLLNEYARREIDGEDRSILFRRKVQSSFSACEKSVDNMDVLLDELFGTIDSVQ